jgi:hypothetical protein
VTQPMVEGQHGPVRLTRPFDLRTVGVSVTPRALCDPALHKSAEGRGLMHVASTSHPAYVGASSRSRTAHFRSPVAGSCVALSPEKRRRTLRA